MKHLKLLFPVLGLFLICFSSSGNGVGIVDGSTGSYMTIVNSSVNVSVNNQIAITTVTQLFRNDLNEDVQFKYGFPLNEGANPTSLRWYFAGEWHEAAFSANEQNDSIPGSSTSLDPALEAYLGDYPMFFTPSDTIPPDSLFTIEFTYVELLPYEFGVVSYKYPNDLTGIQDQIIEAQTFTFQLISEREITMIDLLGFETTDNINSYDAELMLNLFEESATADLQVDYELASDGLGLIPLSTMVEDSVFDCDTLGNGFVTMILEPESNVDTEVIEKNFTLIIDRSGSMNVNNKIEQAREAATFIVNNLNFGDYFNIIDFSSNINSLFPSHVEYTTANQNTALSYIDAINADGTTNISEALVTAISQFGVVDTSKANIIIFFTDGEATAGETSTTGILQAVENEINFTETSVFLFTFGIGDDANEGLLTSLAQENSGLAQFVGEENLEEEITSFFLTINNPVLLNTSIDFEPDIINAVYPSPIPNLYKGQQLIVSGRYNTAQDVVMHVDGLAFNVPVSYDFEISLSDSSDLSMSVLPKIWAKQKIDDLTYDFYTASTSDEADVIQTEIDSISLCYEILSIDFGSFTDPGGGTTGEEEELIEPCEVRVFPIPFENELNISLSFEQSSNEDLRLEILDPLGRVLYTEIVQAFGRDVFFTVKGLSHLSSGIYVLRISGSQGSITRNIVKR